MKEESNKIIVIATCAIFILIAFKIISEQMTTAPIAMIATIALLSVIAIEIIGKEEKKCKKKKKEQSKKKKNT